MDTGHLIDHFSGIWKDAPVSFPSFETSYSHDDRAEREKLFTTYTDRFRELRGKGDHPGSVDTEKFFRGFRSFMKNIYGYSEESLSVIMDQAMVDASRAFFREARAFDPGLKREEIYQGLRNVWIMNGLQLMLGLPVRITPSILAYSLLYPYSDNLLDDPTLSGADKAAFSDRFEQCLRGRGPMGNNHRERCISALVEMIAGEYPRDRYPQVHQSLLAIHRAQTRSLRLCNNGNQLTGDEILAICFDKGGTSVLADGYLVAGNLSPETSRFFYGYGVWLQLADDLQDLEEDLANNTTTLFSGRQENEERLALTNRTFHFGRKIMEDIKYCEGGVSQQFGEVILKSIETMMIQSAGLNHRFYSPEYRKTLEYFSPVGFDYLAEARKKGSPGRMKMITRLIDDQMVPSAETAPTGRYSEKSPRR